MGKYLSTILDLIFPRHCLGCHRSGEYLCSNCLASLPRAGEEPGDDLAPLAYADPQLKRAIWLFKYRKIKSLAPLFARLLADELLETLASHELFSADNQRWILTAVPQTAKRFRERGFNQAAELARALLDQTPEIFELNVELLKKIKDTPTQVSLSDRRQRLNNLKGAFVVSQPEAVRGRRIVVVDDVSTTGATLGETKRVLKEAGATIVVGAAVARG